MAEATGRSRRQVRAARRGHHRQGQRRGSVAVRGHPAGDPRRRGRHGPQQRRDRRDRDRRRGRSGGFHRPERHDSRGDVRIGARRGPRPRAGARRGRRACCPRPGRIGRAPGPRGGRNGRHRHRRTAGRCRPGRAHDTGRSAAAPRARAVGRPGRRDRRRRSDHPRRRPQARRGHPHRDTSTRAPRSRVLRARPSPRPAAPGTRTRRGGEGRHAGGLPGRGRRGPPPDDPDAPGDRRADDPRARGSARLRPYGGRCQLARPGARGREARLPGSRGDLAQLRALRDQGRGRGAPSLPDVQRPLDRCRARRQAAYPHGRRRRRRRRPARAGRPRRGPALDQRPQPGHRRRGGQGPGGQAPARRLRRRARSPSTTPAGSVRT